MGADPLFASSSPADPSESGQGIFSSQSIIFILPTHLTLDKLHETESRLVEHGGKITYDIGEAGLVLGKIGQQKRAALELRSRGIWTEDYPSLSDSTQTTTSGDKEPPIKRRKCEKITPASITGAGAEIVDLSTESESEEDGARNRKNYTQHLVQVQDPPGTVTVLKLEWLDRSIIAEKPLPYDSFIVYKGQKIKCPEIEPAKTSTQKLPSQIIQRAKEDAALQPPPVPTNRFHSRRSKEPHDGIPSHRPPVLYRQTTSENDETAALPPQPDWVRNQVLYACMRSAPLHPPNADFIAQLVKIRRIRELTLDEIGVRAYSTSIASISAYPYVLKRPGEVLALPGCDVKIANLFAEFQQHGGCNHTDDDGNVAAADALDTDPVLHVLDMFSRIWGVGPKTARDFYHKGWRDLDDIVEYGWNSLSRVQQIGVKFYDEFEAGVPRGESEMIADIVRRHAQRVRGVDDIECVIVGGYRRGKEISGDVDLVLTHRDDSVTRSLVVDVVASLEKEGYITHTLALHLTSTLREQATLPFRGDDTGKHFDSLDKALVVWQDPVFDSNSTEASDGNRRKNPNPHRRVDIIISPWRTVGCAVLGWSGDTTFERDLRRYARKAHGWKFDSSGVRERTAGGQVVDLEHGGETWERERLVMERMGIGWRPPEERCTR